MVLWAWVCLLPGSLLVNYPLCSPCYEDLYLQPEGESINLLFLPTQLSTPRQGRLLLTSTAFAQQAHPYSFILPLPHGMSLHLSPLIMKEGRQEASKHFARSSQTSGGKPVMTPKSHPNRFGLYSGGGAQTACSLIAYKALFPLQIFPFFPG